MNTTAASLHEIELPGCTPEPLMAYLKALGIFRLVAEQKDPAVRSYWRNDMTFVLHSSLDREALLAFFLEEYRPTPIMAPWNGGSGFYPRDDKKAINSLRSDANDRLDPYKDAISAVNEIMVMEELIRQFEEAEEIEDPAARRTARSEANKARSQAKEAILADCRNWLPEPAVAWLDAAYVLTTDGPRYPPLLGTGGNDGRLEFTNNFMQNILMAFSMPTPGQKRIRSGGRPSSNPQKWLEAALFGDVSPALIRAAIGQFAPGGAGGPNATAGFEGDSLVNPWDYILMMEGALFFAGAVTRRLSAESRGRAVFPFTVETSAAGYGTAVDTEYTSDGARAELWAPLWQQPATHKEISHLFGEGRGQVGKRQASTGTDFARAVVGLGIERGISSFQRFGFLKRNGLSFIATPLGRFRVTPKPEANLLFDLDRWLERLRGASRSQNAPHGLSRALREIEQTILAFCSHGGSHSLLDVLVSLGRAESWLANSRLKNSVFPLPTLSAPWLEGCDDGSSEFRLAAALASIQGVGDVGAIRSNLEPVVFFRGRWQWSEDQHSVVLHNSDVTQTMAAVLQRRCLDAGMKSLEQLPLEAKIPLSLADIHAFLEGRVDYRRIADLLLPLTAINWRQVSYEFAPTPVPLTLSRTYATLKLLFLPWLFRRHSGVEQTPIRPETSILALLQGGRAVEACQVAHRRLQASGLKPISPETGVQRHLGRRLTAALLLPIDYRDMYSLADTVLLPA